MKPQTQSQTPASQKAAVVTQIRRITGLLDPATFKFPAGATALGIKIGGKPVWSNPESSQSPDQAAPLQSQQV
jgi:hypothetical protein